LSEDKYPFAYDLVFNSINDQGDSMLKKILFAVAALVASIGFAFANVDVNKADQAALDGVKGIGPTMSKAILAERKKGGEFKDWEDFQSRVKGIGEKNSAKFSQSGLTVNGAAKPDAKPATKTKEKAAGKEKAADASAKSDAQVTKAEKKDAKAKP
jgi:competence protein ComEA